MPMLMAAVDLTISPDGLNVYVVGASEGKPAVVTFVRSGTSNLSALPRPMGCLVPVGSARNCRHAPGLASYGGEPTWGPNHGLAVSPDGRSVHLAVGASVIAFARDQQTNGALLETADAPVPRRAIGLALSPDGRFLYATNDDGLNGSDSIFGYRVTP